uniref:Putative secreted protein n=1 Tax=Anopheles darlingi TaxID=43151 RepID=A0A2M4D3P1_ANODA
MTGGHFCVSLSLVLFLFLLHYVWNAIWMLCACCFCTTIDSSAISGPAHGRSTVCTSSDVGTTILRRTIIIELLLVTRCPAVLSSGSQEVGLGRAGHQYSIAIHMAPTFCCWKASFRSPNTIEKLPKDGQHRVICSKKKEKKQSVIFP